MKPKSLTGDQTASLAPTSVISQTNYENKLTSKEKSQEVHQLAHQPNRSPISVIS